MIDIHELDPTPIAHANSGPLLKIYVEGQDDAVLYNRLLGPTLRNRIVFLQPMAGPDGKLRGGWYHALLASQKENETTGRRCTYCLLDGEEAARYGDGLALISAREPVFELASEPTLEGVLFLGCFEKENLWYWHIDVWDMLLAQPPSDTRRKRRKRNNNSTARSEILHHDGADLLDENQRLSDASRTKIWELVDEQKVHSLIERMFIKGVMRLAIKNVTKDYRPKYKLLDKLGNRNFSIRHTMKELIKEVKTIDQKDPEGYYLKIKSQLKVIRTAVFGDKKRIDFSAHARREEILVLCDSKDFFEKAVDTNFHGWERWAYFFDDKLARSEFAVTFQSAIRRHVLKNHQN